ncbi:MAG: transaldolase [Anaerolineae bacterium]
MTKLHELAELGQAVWMDYIRRSLITSGELGELMAQGVRGVTSNPTIFDKAISGSTDYDEDLAKLVEQGKVPEQILDALVLDDIARAADILRPLYDETDGLDGFVSLEVDPRLAHNTCGTVVEARRYSTTLKRPNVLIKVPATPAGIPAIQELIYEGISVNVTLIFSVQQYEAVADAYIAGLERRASADSDLHHIASVASFFVSRVDTAVDRALEKVEHPDLGGQAAVANAKIAYERFQELFSDKRWTRLAERGARVQRPLWASTSAKNPAYPDTLYVDNLIGPHTVNTMPPETIAAVMDHGRVERTIDQGVAEAKRHLRQLEDVGVDVDSILQRLQDDGVDAFAQSFASLLQSIEAKTDATSIV